LSDHEKLQWQKDTLFDRFGGSTEKPVPKKREKKKKEKPVATHLVTLEHIKQKKSLDTIAAERSISYSTVLNHLEKLKGLKMLDNADLHYLKEALADDDFENIFSALKDSENGWLTPVYQTFEGKYSYEDIRLVRVFVME